MGDRKLESESLRCLFNCFFSLAASRADNFYYPPGWTRNQGSLNKFRGQHALRERARKLDQGILIISLKRGELLRRRLLQENWAFAYDCFHQVKKMLPLLHMLKFNFKFEIKQEGKRALINPASIFSESIGVSTSNTGQLEPVAKRRKINSGTAFNLLAGAVKPSSWSQWPLPSSRNKDPVSSR